MKTGEPILHFGKIGICPAVHIRKKDKRLIPYPRAVCAVILEFVQKIFLLYPQQGAESHGVQVLDLARGYHHVVTALVPHQNLPVSVIDDAARGKDSRLYDGVVEGVGLVAVIYHLDVKQTCEQDKHSQSKAYQNFQVSVGGIHRLSKDDGFGQGTKGGAACGGIEPLQKQNVQSDGPGAVYPAVYQKIYSA